MWCLVCTVTGCIYTYLLKWNNAYVKRLCHIRLIFQLNLWWSEKKPRSGNRNRVNLNLVLNCYCNIFKITEIIYIYIYRVGFYSFYRPRSPLGWVEVYLHSFLGPSALDGGGGSAPRPGLLYPRERPGIHCTGGWVGPRNGLDGRKISFPPEFDPGRSSP